VQNLVSGLVAIVIVVAAFTFAVLVRETWAIVLGSLVGLLFIFCLIMLPISAAMDVGGRIPEIKTASGMLPKNWSMSYESSGA